MHPDLITQVLIVEDEFDQAELLSAKLRGQGCQTSIVNTIKKAEAEFERRLFDVVVLDWRLKDARSGEEFLLYLRDGYPAAYVVVYSSYPEANARCTELGADDFVLKGHYGLDAVTLAVHRGLRRSRQKIDAVIASEHRAPALERMVGVAPAMQRLREQIHRAATSNAPVLIQGETGTGKELVAQAIHEQSSRSEFRFVTVFCPGVPESTLESELFGHVKGAFTGAQEGRMGLFESGNRGSIFLDEICELPISLQAKLLRAVEYKLIRKIGSNDEKTVDVRVIAATNRNLSQAVKERVFREDLFHRLRGIEIQVPSLREREGDIELLIRHLLKSKGLDPDRLLVAEVVKTLLSYHYPGNVRELELMIERAIINSDGKPLSVIDFGLLAANKYRLPSEDGLFDRSIQDARAEFDRIYCRHWLNINRGNVQKTAAAIGMSRNRLTHRLKDLGIVADDFRR